MKILHTLSIFAVTLALSACAPNYSDGTRVGVITKISHKGLIFKSWEGSLNQGGTKNSSDGNGNTTVVANVTDFNVQDSTLLKKIQEAAASGKRVELTYSQWFVSPINIDSFYVIKDVKILD